MKLLKGKRLAPVLVRSEDVGFDQDLNAAPSQCRFAWLETRRRKVVFNLDFALYRLWRLQARRRVVWQVGWLCGGRVCCTACRVTSPFNHTPVYETRAFDEMALNDPS